MKKQYVIGAILGIVGLWVVLKTGLLVMVAVFLLTGLLPGTGLSVPPILMLGLLMALFLIVMRWVKRQELANQIRALKAATPKRSGVSTTPNSTARQTVRQTAGSSQKPKRTRSKKQPVRQQTMRRRFTHLHAS